MLRIYLKALLPILVYAIMQLMGELLILVWKDTSAIPCAVILSGILSAIIIHYGLHMTNFPECFNASKIQWRMAIVGILAAIMGAFALDWMAEQIEMPNPLADLFIDISQNPIGILAIALVGPVCEEFTFREGIQGFLHRNGASSWAAILFSALCFGIIHMNPAQTFFATLLGIILGIIYYKTGNIVVTSIVHIINNSIAVSQMHIYGEEAKDMRFDEMVGGSHIAWVYIILFCTMCISQLIIFWKQYKTNKNEL